MLHETIAVATLITLITITLIRSSPMTKTLKVKPRGIRNNNPGNLVRGRDQWTGLQPAIEQNDHFYKFTEPVYGLRALSKTLKTYQSKHNLHSVKDIIHRYAPPVENDTDSYAIHVAQALDVPVTAPINLDDYKTMRTIMQTIVQHENGQDPYPLSLYQTAIELAAVT